MGKGATVIGSLHRQLTPDNVGPEHVEPTFLQGEPNNPDSYCGATFSRATRGDMKI